MTKKQLRAELEKANNMIAHLQSDVARLEADRSDLADQLSDPIKKADRDLYLALSNNITNSLNQKNAVNMKPDEKDAVYYLLERLVQIKKEGETGGCVKPYNPFLNSINCFSHL